MNPLTNVKNINKLNEIELTKGTVDKKSWHDLYKESAWIFIGGLAYGLTEGDILCVFSQYGEIVNINLVRDKKTGKIKGFCFLCYANQKSTILAVDNLNGIKLCSRTIRVDHVANYKPPKDHEQDDEITKMLKSEGCAPKLIKTENSIQTDEQVLKTKHKKHKKEKKKHKKRKRENSEEEFSLAKVKKEKPDEGYSKYEFPEKSVIPSRRRESSESKSFDGSSDSDSTSIAKEEKQKTNRFGKSSRKNDKHHVDNAKHKSRKESASSSESDNHFVSKGKSVLARSKTSSSSSERRVLKHLKSKRRNHSDSSSDECSEKRNINPKNLNKEDSNARNYSSRQRHDSSSESEENFYSRKNSIDRGKHERKEFAEREKLFYKNKKHEDPHRSDRDYKNRQSPPRMDRHKDRKNYEEKERRKEYGKHYSRQRET